MLFLEHVCCKIDVFDKTYKGHQNAESMVNIADHRHRVSTSSASKLFPVQSPGQDNAKRGLDEPDILEVVICRKHMSYKILQALQLGIRDLSGRYMELAKEELLPLDFKSTQSTWIQYSKQNTNALAPGAVSDFQWKDYSPAVFRYLRELGNINNADYMFSVCGPETLREISSPGKSGSLLFRSKDGRLVIKTLRKHEVKVLCKMLPNYLYHVKQYRTSLLIKLYGLHAVRPIGGQKVYFVVMENVLQLDVHMHRSYDLKGSSQGRTISKYRDHERATFKDLDLDFIFYLNPQTRHNLLEQIRYDCGFLEAQGIMDYSLLLGVHLEARNQGNKSGARYDSLQACGDLDWAPADIYQTPGRPGAKLGVKMPARAVRVPRNRKDGLPFDTEARTGECYDALLYFGIIDILQVYNVKKHLEHAYKSIRKPKTEWEMQASFGPNLASKCLNLRSGVNVIIIKAVSQYLVHRQ